MEYRHIINISSALRAMFNEDEDCGGADEEIKQAIEKLERDAVNIDFSM